MKQQPDLAIGIDPARSRSRRVAAARRGAERQPAMEPAMEPEPRCPLDGQPCERARETEKR